MHEINKLREGLREDFSKELYYLRKSVRFHVSGVAVHTALILFILYLSRNSFRRDMWALCLILSNAVGTTIRHSILYFKVRKEIPLAQIRDVMEK